jgi:hypothetical protein
MDRWARCGPVVWCVLLGLMLAAGGWCQPAGTPGADDGSQPVYGEIRLPLEGQNTLRVAFAAAERGGPRDLFYADKNCNDQFEDNECQRANVHTVQGSPNLYLSFPSLQLRVPQGDAGGPLLCFLSVQSTVIRNSARPVPQQFMYALSFGMGTNRDRYSYVVNGPVRTSLQADQAPLVGPEGDIAMKLEARPDTKTSGNTGLGVSFAWGGSSVTGRHGSAGLSARVVVKSVQGGVVRDDQTDTSKAAFG